MTDADKDAEIERLRQIVSHTVRCFDQHCGECYRYETEAEGWEDPYPPIASEADPEQTDPDCTAPARPALSRVKCAVFTSPGVRCNNPVAKEGDVCWVKHPNKEPAA